MMKSFSGERKVFHKTEKLTQFYGGKMTFQCNYSTNNSNEMLRLATKLAARTLSQNEILLKLNRRFIS